MSEEPVKRDMEVLWTPKQVANYLHVRPNTVYRWIAEGRMFDQSKIIRFSNRVRIPRSEVERIAGATKEKLLGESSNNNPSTNL